MTSLASQHAKDVLRRYLSQYQVAKLRQKKLKDRHDVLERDIGTPIHATRYGGLPVSGGTTSEGSASVIFRMAELEDKIQNQQKRMAEVCMRVMAILDYLPEASDERMITEFRYIDGMEWNDIADNTYWSKRTCFRIEEKAICRLLEFDRVRELAGIT